jgi:DNA-binding CsgD family transcriptional regulator
VLVGRELEQRAIARLLAAARVGDSGVLVLSGEPGIGKSALLTDAATSAGEMRLLRASGVASEQFVPFAGLLQLLRPVLDLLDHIPSPQSAALSSALLLGGPPVEQPSRFAVGAATLSLLSRSAEERPLLVLVDDAHLLDQPSAEALVFAARRLVSDPVAVVAAIRPGEAGQELWSPLPALTVGGLDLEATGTLVRRRVGEVRTDQLQRLHRLTAGNPLALLELGGRLEELELTPESSPVEIPAELSRAFRQRLEGMPDSTRATLLVAAADSASAATVFAAAAEMGVVEARLDEAEAAGLVSVAGDRVEFRHPLVRSAVYADATAADRRAAHRALASVVPPEQIDRLAWHLAKGAVAPDETTARMLDHVSVQASSRGAHAIAAYASERAAALSASSASSGRRAAAAGEAAWLAGMRERARALLERALAAEPDPVRRAHVHEVRAAIDARCGALPAALAALTAAAADVAATDADTAVRLLADSVHVAFYLGDTPAATRAGSTIERLLGAAADPDTRALGQVAAGMALVLSGSGARGIGMVREAAYRLIDAEETGDRFRLPLRVQGALWLRDSGPHRALLVESVDRLRERAALGTLPYLLMHIARDAATTDRWEDAEAAYLESIRLAEETGQATDLAVAWAGLASLHARMGRESECGRAVLAAEELCRTNPARLATYWVRTAQGDLAAGLGDPVGAAAHYEALELLLASNGMADPDQSCGPELVEVYLQLGRGEEARRLAASYLARAEAKAQPWALARAERARAVCAPDAVAEAAYRSALEWHAATPDRYECARTELALGSWLRRTRRRGDARGALRSALDAFELLGARPWAERAARELAATGERVRRREASPVDQLTPQERQIAQLLARGRTTRETAAVLFLSPKTVEYHLRHVYQKLGIRSRAELTERFGGDR